MKIHRIEIEYTPAMAQQDGLTIKKPNLSAELLLFSEFTCEEITAAFLFKTGRTYKEISHFLKIDKNRIRYCVDKVCAKYPHLRRV